MRAVHWLGAVELVGGVAALSPRFVARLAAALLGDAHYLATHLEDTGIVPANHLLGDYVGLWVLGLALEGAPGARGWQALAARGLAVEAERQVGADGAHFEASTAYHRWALELMLTAHLWARAAGRSSPLGEPLRRMFLFLRHYVGPDGCEPGFGDGDDGRVYPIVPHPARYHAYLLPVGATLFGESWCKPRGGDFTEEALWLCGPDAAAVWSALPSTPELPAVSFPSGGVHVLRSDRWQVALRSGSYGQKGVGGHAHNDQLSVVAWLDGAPLVVDPGTARYAADMVVRNRFRGTAAHSTVVVDGAEQSPILDGRPFALLDRAQAPRVRLEERGALALVEGSHDGYRRLRGRVRHRRRVILRRDLDALVLEDELDGNGDGAVELRLHLGKPARLGASNEQQARLEEVGRALGLALLDQALVVVVGDPVCALIAGTCPQLVPCLETGEYSEAYGSTQAITLVTFRNRLIFPASMKTVLVTYGANQGSW
jgi:heparinase II/III-like protein